MSPLATNPRATREYVLESDRGLPKDAQPSFTLRYPTCFEVQEICRMEDRITDDMDVGEIIELAMHRLIPILSGWKNLKGLDGKPIKSAAQLTTVLSLDEIKELLGDIVSHSPTAADKKKLSSPSPSGSRGSAKRARGKVTAKRSNKKNR